MVGLAGIREGGKVTRQIPAVPIDAAAIVGKLYMVPCVRIIGEKEWVPVLGPKHEDREIIGFIQEHYHHDPRFMTKKNFEIGKECSPDVPGGILLTVVADEALFFDDKTELETSFQVKVCKREMPTFPVSNFRDSIRAAYANHTLKDGLVCPHRGVPLAPFETAEGFAICPGHGLCWDLRNRRMATEEEEAKVRSK
jgi:hypothetical protein